MPSPGKVSSGPCRVTDTTKTSETFGHPSSSAKNQNKKSVVGRRYVNSAVYTERIVGIKKVHPSQIIASHSDDTIVDLLPLELDSVEHKDSEHSLETKVAGIKISPHIAYENWRIAKKTQLRHSQQEKQLERQIQLELLEERKKLNDLKVQKWLESKKRQAEMMTKSLNKTISSTTASSFHSSKTSFGQSFKINNTSLERSKSSITSSTLSLNSDEKVRAWLKKKNQLARQKLMKQREAEMRALKEAEERKRKADEAYQNWLAKAGNRTKPVSFSQSYKSLRGTTNTQFWNPNEWVN